MPKKANILKILDPIKFPIVYTIVTTPHKNRTNESENKIYQYLLALRSTENAISFIISWQDLLLRILQQTKEVLKRELIK